MSLVKVSGNAGGTGTLTIAAPNTNSDYTLTLPAATSTLVGTDATQTLTNKTIQGGAITSGTAVASTSGTSIDFTSIPSWVKRITVMFSGVSTNGNSAFLMQIGSGSFTTSGYSSCSVYTGTGSGATALTTTGFVMMHGDTGEAHSGTYSIFLLSGNVYVGSGVYAWTTGGTYGALGGGNSSALSGALDRVRITTVGGTNTFDAGSINILYEG